ncbi:MAG TPA: acetate--CoA ligase family protein [Streptosporangiaceae bacterium]|nr:acetate--CoA ligase family protein [Streptosporangiaceae bacterium]
MAEAGSAGAGTAGQQAARSPLARLLCPTSIAFVGLSDNSHFCRTVQPTFASDAEIFMVNPRYDTVLGRPTVPSLTDLGRPVDAVLSCMSAERTTELVEEAAGLDVGGVVLIANGFAEIGGEGEALQARLTAAARAAGVAAIGPNGLGFINVPLRVSLTIASHHKRRPGGISIVSHSGAMLSGAAMAAWNYPDSGLNVLVSAGNEAVTDLADYVDYFVTDPSTKAIGLMLEKIRRPEEFFEAVGRATEAGKPVVVLKLARTEQSRQMAVSHTGALTGDAWVYDVALRQAGVALAYDVEELIDRLALFDQLPPQRWTPVSSLGVVTRTGGFASLAADLAVVEGVPIAPLESYKAWLAERVPGVTVPNPLDAASFGAATWPEIINKYVTDPDLDAILMIQPVSDEDVSYRDGVPLSPVVEYAEAALQVSKPCVIANCSGVPGDWIKDHLRGALVRGRGLRPSLQGLATVGAFVRYRASRQEPAIAGPPLARPETEPVRQPEGLMLPFAATMALLAEHGIPVAPYHLVGPAADAARVQPPFPGPYVAKLADVAHRTEHQAVRLRVGAGELGEAVADLRAIAASDALPTSVAIQPMLEASGEALLGIQGESELGPLVVLGLGGVFTEVLNRVGGRMAPFTRQVARELIEEFADLEVMHGFRGRPAWDLDALAAILVAAGQLAARGREWIATLDVNPLVYSPAGFFAVDALLLLRDPRR